MKRAARPQNVRLRFLHVDVRAGPFEDLSQAFEN